MLSHFFAGCFIALAGIPAITTPDGTANRVATTFPDIVIPGTRGIKVELQINAQALIDHCCVQYVIAKGDTLSQIAAKHRNHTVATTVEDILALNPGLNPNKLVVSQRIWMPPRIPATTSKENTFVFLAKSWSIGSLKLEHGYAPTDKVTPSRRIAHAFWLIPASQWDNYAKLQKARDWDGLDNLKKAGKIQSLTTGGSSHSVWDESPVYSCKDKITIERSSKGMFSAKFTSVAYDKAGKVVSPEERIKDHRKNKKGMWFLMLPLFGGGWLLWRSRRQRTPDQYTPATLATA